MTGCTLITNHILGLTGVDERFVLFLSSVFYNNSQKNASVLKLSLHYIHPTTTFSLVVELHNPTNFAFSASSPRRTRHHIYTPWVEDTTNLCPRHDVRKHGQPYKHLPFLLIQQACQTGTMHQHVAIARHTRQILKKTTLVSRSENFLKGFNNDKKMNQAILELTANQFMITLFPSDIIPVWNGYPIILKAPINCLSLSVTTISRGQLLLKN